MTLLLAWVFTAAPLRADTASDAEELFDWAERSYPQYFPTHAVTQSAPPWRYRYYNKTGIYLGVNTSNASLYIQGDRWGNTPTQLGLLGQWLTTARGGQLALAWSTGGTHINVARNEAVVSSLTASPSTGSLHWNLSAGALPAGITLNTNGKLTGATNVAGEYRFTAQAQDSVGNRGNRDFILTVNAPTLSGTVQQSNFIYQGTGRSVPFSLYLPPGYAQGTKRYPVIFHFHGIGGTHNGQHISTVPLSYEAAVRAGLVRDAIIVFPDGFRDAWWADSIDGSKPAETHVISALLPYIDNNYRTDIRQGMRIASGFSMGGFGAAKFATKYPDFFAAALINDGAMLNWSQIQTSHADGAASIFGNSADRFDQYSPWYWLKRNASTLSNVTRLRSAAAALGNANVAWRDAVSAAGVGMEYVETNLPHILDDILDAQGTNMWQFAEWHFARVAPGE